MLWWILQRLKSSSWQTRAEAAARLQESHQKNSVPALVKALEDEHPQVRLAVIRALGALRNPKAAEPLSAALAGIALRPKEMRSSAEHAEYEALAAALGAIGSASVIPLLRLLDSGDRDVRRWAAHALGLTRDARAIAPLIKQLQDHRSEARRAAALALGAIGQPQALDPLVKALSSRDLETRCAAADALGMIGSEQAVNALCSISGDPNEPVQLAVVEALRRIGGLRAGAGMRTIIDSSKKNVREAAAAALNSLKLEPATAEERAAAAVMKNDFQGAIDEGAAAAPALIAALNSKDPRRRCSSAEALGQMRAPGAVAALLQALRDHDPSVQDAAVKSLVAAGSDAIEGLLSMLSHHDPTVRRQSACALGQIGNPRAVHGLAGIIATNHLVSNESLDLLEGIRAAADALTAILTTRAADVAHEDLLGIGNLPDVVVTSAALDARAPAVDCEPLRMSARQEIRERGLTTLTS
jgi:HEAT repeat protein